MEIESVAAVTDLDRWLEEHDLVGSWAKGDPAAASGTGPDYPPFLWKWADVHEALTRVGPVLAQHPELNERMAGYKHIGLEHPGLPTGTSPTINMSAQVQMPGELGEARRHLQAE